MGEKLEVKTAEHGTAGLSIADGKFLFDNGTLPGGERLTLQDVIATPNAAPFMRKVIETVVREAVEPYLVISQLFQTLRFQHGSAIIQIPTIGALSAQRIPEGGEYPERNPDWSGAVVTAQIDKHGLAVKVTEEMERYSQFDVIGLLLKQAGKALARHKEKQCADMLSALGTVCFDNVTPAASMYGVMTGRDMQGNANGSLTMDNLLDAWVQIMMQGFNPNVLIMHPLAFAMFLKDPYLQAFALAAGGGAFYGGWSGNAQNANPFGGYGGGTSGPGKGTYIIPGGNAAGEDPTAKLDYSQTLTSKPNIPDRFPHPLNIVISPLVRFDTRHKLTDIFIADSSVIGVILQDEPPTTEDFNDPARDMRKIKIRERYALAILEEGQGIGKLANVHLVPNEIVLPLASIDVSGSNLAPISPTATISL